MVASRVEASAFGDLSLAVLVGVSRYSDSSVRPLPACTPETQRLAAAFLNPTGCRIPEGNVDLLVDETATHTRVLAALKARSAVATPDQLLIFYFAGHGEPMEKGFALLLHDSILADLGNTSLTSFELDEVFAGCKARGVLLILDCCGGAALAENAPGFTQRVGQHEFRILLSASRADQSSWETAKGSLFTRHLLDVVEGRVQISNAPGEVYFNDLLNHLRLSVAEEIAEAGGTLPLQEPVFNGGYVNDPLIFVHTGETLKQIRVRVQRYSQAYLRQRVRRTALAILALFGIGFGGYWMLLDQHYFIEAGDKALFLKHGYPGLTGLGYPKLVWTIELERSRLSADTPLSRGNPVVFRRGAPAFPVVADELSPAGRAQWQLWAGQTEAARLTAQQGMSAAPADRPNDWFELAQVFAAAANAKDLDKLEELSQHQNPSVVQASIRALARIGQAEATRVLARRGFDFTQSGYHLEALQGWDRPCSDPLQSYLNEFAKAPAYAQFTRATVLAALRAECLIQIDLLLGAQTAFQGTVATYWALRGGADAKSLAADLRKEIGQAVRAMADGTRAISLDKLGVVGRMVEMALALPKDGCPLAKPSDGVDADPTILARFGRFLSALDQAIGSGRSLHTRARLGALIARTCPGIDVVLNLEMTELANSSIALVDASGERLVIGSFRRGPISVPLEVLQLAEQIRRPDQVPHLKALLATNSDSYQKSRLVRRLRLLGAPVSDIGPFFARGEQELQIEAYLWQAAGDRKLALDSALARLGDPTASFLPDVLAALVADPETRLRVVSAASAAASDEARRTALIVLFGTDHQVAEKLLDPRFEVRAAAIDYLDYRDDIAAIRVMVEPRLVLPTFFAQNWSSIAEHQRRLREELTTTPDWSLATRAKLILDLRNDLSNGMRLWINNEVRRRTDNLH